ncbi:MAG: hypothetical protein WDA27_04835 [Actinomycetota bacterium]
MADVYAGLDCEMTGTNLDVHDVCQIGVYLNGHDPFVSDVLPSRPHIFDPKALAVNGFTRDRLEAAPSAAFVDAQLLAWLEQRLEGAEAHPVGWGVSYFDMPFVRKALPETWRRLSRRSVELTSVCFVLAGKKEILDTGKAGQTLGWRGWKRASKRFAEERLAEFYDQPRWHDAGYDATAAYYSFEFLKQAVHG